jgi:hypothetical protein
MEIIILMAWSIWTTRNDWIFNNIDPSVENCKQKFISEFSLMMHKIRTDKAPPMLVWLHTLLDLAVIFLFVFLSVPHFVLFFLLLVCTRFSLLCNTLVFLIICSRGLAPPVFFKKKKQNTATKILSWRIVWLQVNPDSRVQNRLRT